MYMVIQDLQNRVEYANMQLNKLAYQLLNTRNNVGVAEWLRNGLQIRIMGVRVSPSTPNPVDI